MKSQDILVVFRRRVPSHCSKPTSLTVRRSWWSERRCNNVTPAHKIIGLPVHVCH